MTGTVRLTTAQALVRWLVAQRSELLDGTEVPLFPGVFAIFGHGNVLGLGTALHEAREEIPTWRGQNEQGMALAAIAYARATDRRQVMVATSSVGPGALNMVTAAGLAHANRLPVLLLPGDTFTSRAPDPVLQQVEHFGDPSTSVNDSFRAVSRYFDRITRPEQLLSTLPQVVRVLTDPADCGPVVLALPQDAQVEKFDFPEAMFATRVHRIPRQRPDRDDLADAAATLRRPSGRCWSSAAGSATRGLRRRRWPSPRPTACRSSRPSPDGRSSPMTTGCTAGRSASSVPPRRTSWPPRPMSCSRSAPDSRTSRRPPGQGSPRTSGWSRSTRHASTRSSTQLRPWSATRGRRWSSSPPSCLTGWRIPAGPMSPPASWPPGTPTSTSCARASRRDGALTYAQVVGVVNDASGPEDYVLTASGGMPGELHGGWRTGIVKQEGSPTSGATMDLEYGFSCMGYEVVAPWGAAMARAQTHPGGLVTGLFGDGSYLMLNSELYSAAFSGVPFVAVLCDNSGFAVIHRLQTNQGAEGFNNMLADSRGPGADGSVHVDFAAHARSLGCLVEDVPASAGVEELRAAYDRARAAAREARRPAVVVCRTHSSTWTEAGAWWETGVPESLSGRASYDEAKQDQLRWL